MLGIMIFLHDNHYQPKIAMCACTGGLMQEEWAYGRDSMVLNYGIAT